MKRQYPWFNLRGGSTTPTNWADNIFGLDHGIEIYEEPPPAEQSSSTGTFMEPVVDTEDRPPTLYEEQVRMYPEATEEDLTSMTIDRSRYDTSAAIGSDGSNFYTTRVYAPDDDDEEHDEGYMGEDNLGSPSDEEDDGLRESDIEKFRADVVAPKNRAIKALPYKKETFKEFKNIIIQLKDERALMGMMIVVIAHKSLTTEEIRICMMLHQEHKCTIEGPYKGQPDLYYLVSRLAEYTELEHYKKFSTSNIYKFISKSIVINDWDMYSKNASNLFRYKILEDKSFFINDVLTEASYVFNFAYYNYVVDIKELFKMVKYPVEKKQPMKVTAPTTEEEKPIPTPTPTETVGQQIMKQMEKQDEHPMPTTTIETEDD